MAAAGVHDAALAQALYEVPRECGLGPAPWTSLTLAMGPVQGPCTSADPRPVLHNVAVRSGDGGAQPAPALLALLLHAAAIRQGDEVLLIGTGLAYAQALAGRLAGRDVQVRENPPLGDRADPARRPAGPVLDALLVLSGCSRLPWPWLDRLRPGGRAVFPLLGLEGTAVYWRLTRPAHGHRWPASPLTLGETLAWPAAWDPSEAALADALAHRLLEVRSVLPTADDGEAMVLVCDNGCFSTTEAPARPTPRGG